MLVLSVLIGCQSENLDISDEVTTIEVYEWDSKEQVAVINDEEFIEELVKELDSTATASTANMDFASPNYVLHFNNNEETLVKMGYYKEVMNLGEEGRYWNFKEGEMYGVETELPRE